MAEEFKWFQIAAQMDQVMTNYKGMAALQDMLIQAAQVEAYLKNAGAIKDSLEGQIEEKHGALRQVAQEYADLQETLNSEKAEHTSQMRAYAVKRGQRERELEAEMHELEKEYAQKRVAMESQYKAAEVVHNEALAVLDSKCALADKKLQDAEMALNALKEKL